MAAIDEQMQKDVDMLDGKPPYNTPSNIYWHDGYYDLSLEKKYGMKIEDMRRIIKQAKMQGE